MRDGRTARDGTVAGRTPARERADRFWTRATWAPRT